MTWSTSRPKGALPVVASQRPITPPRRTSQAARYASAPPRSYSCSTRAGWCGPGGVVGWRRTRAWMLVFSSALRMQSSGCNRWPSQYPSYRSSTRPAFAAKSGSRGKSQLRERQGLRASPSRMRQMVLRLIGGASGCSLTRRARSAVLERLSGSSRRAGSSHASALTVATCRGGKSGLAPASRLIGQAEALPDPGAPPVAHPVGVLAQAPRRRGVVDGRVVLQQQRQLGAGDLELGGAVLADQVLAGGQVLGREGRLVGRGRARHRTPPPRQPRRSGQWAPTLPSPGRS